MDKSVIRYVKEIKAGNDQAFNDLYQCIYEDVFRLSYSITHNQTDAKDVTQEVFISIYNNIHRLEDADAFPLWVQRIVFTRCTRLFRKRKDSLMNDNHTRTLSYETEKDIDFLPKEKFDDNNEKKVMHEIVMKLQPKHQEVVSCVYFQQMSLKEAAEYLNRPEGTIKSQLYAARKELYGYIKDYERKNQRKIHFYDLGSPTATGMFAWQRIKEQLLLLKSVSMFWRTSMIISTIVVTITCVGSGISLYNMNVSQSSAMQETNIQPPQQEKMQEVLIMGRSIETPQEAFFTLVEWGGSPENAKTKDPQEIAEMQKVVDILSKERGIYWDRLQKEGWLSVFDSLS